MSTVILIHNQSGAAGMEIARQLASELGLPFYDDASLGRELARAGHTGEKGRMSRIESKRLMKRAGLAIGKTASCVVAGEYVGLVIHAYPQCLRIHISQDGAARDFRPGIADMQYDLVVQEQASRRESILQSIKEFCCFFEMMEIVRYTV